jgi:hypothetical protein
MSLACASGTESRGNHPFGKPKMSSNLAPAFIAPITPPAIAPSGNPENDRSESRLSPAGQDAENQQHRDEARQSSD